jgi:hypothetical protein
MMGTQDYARGAAFDLWGVGVMWLELLLGTIDVWNRIKATAKQVAPALKLPTCCDLSFAARLGHLK